MLLVVILIALVIIGVLLYLLFHYKAQADASQKKASPAAAAANTSLIRPRNGVGHAVDWFFILKLPDHSKNCKNGQGDCSASCACSGCTQPSNCDSWDEKRASGECYWYSDSNSPALQYYTDLSYGCLSDDSSPLQQTIKQLTSGRWAIWNDQPEVGSECSAPHAHSKGAVCYDDKGGFILSTSSPHWPSGNMQAMGCEKDNNVEYAQLVFCFSASSDSINSWLQLVQSASLCVSESSFLDKGPLPGGTTPAPITLNTLAGVPITVMVKGSQDNFLPWSLVSETLQTGISVASWTSTASGGASGWGDASKYNNGRQPLTQIVDVSTPHGCYKALYSYNHAKWGISDRDNWVIVGSMNQQNSQAKRGGDFYAFQNSDLWQSLKGFIANTIQR